MAQLQQIQLVFDPRQDRLLFRVRSDDNSEIRFWLTRRLVKLLWPLMVETLHGHQYIATQQSQAAKEAVMEFQRQQAISNADFATPYQNDAVNLPLGEEPLLASRFQIKGGADNSYILCIHPPQGQGIELALNDALLHSFCALLVNTVKKAEWGLDLTLVQAETQAKVRPDKLN